jgi:hypothetical protein
LIHLRCSGQFCVGRSGIDTAAASDCQENRDEHNQTKNIFAVHTEAPFGRNAGYPVTYIVAQSIL